MLEEYAFFVLVLMGSVYSGGAIVCALTIALCLSNKLKSQAVISLVSLVAITITSIICLLPLLKMHGSYSDGDTIGIMSIWGVNIVFITFTLISRVRVINGIHGNSASSTHPINGDPDGSIYFAERAIRHRRIIGYLWLIPGCVGMALASYSIVNALVRDPEKALGFIPGITLSVLLVVAGYSLIKSLPWSRRLCLPISVLALTVFPIGTMLGGYYLWYFLDIERQSLRQAIRS